jgi:hypothetical protein
MTTQGCWVAGAIRFQPLGKSLSEGGKNDEADESCL